MAVSDFYVFRSGSISVAQTTALALMSVIAGTTVRGWVTGIEINIGNTTAVAGNNMLFQLCRPGNTPNGSAGSSGGADDFSAPASIVQGYTTWTTAPTVGTIVWEVELPQASGQPWAFFPPTGQEYQIPAIANNAANAGLHLFVTASVNTSTPVFVNLTVSE